MNKIGFKPLTIINKGGYNMGFGIGGGYGGSTGGGCGGGYPYFDGSFILFLVLILLVFGMMPYGGGCGGGYGDPPK